MDKLRLQAESTSFATISPACSFALQQKARLGSIRLTLLRNHQIPQRRRGVIDFLFARYRNYFRSCGLPFCAPHTSFLITASLTPLPFLGVSSLSTYAAPSGAAFFCAQD
jgi:hypothetical protein